MSDLQTALTKALEDGKRKFLSTTVNEWDAHEQAIRQPQEKIVQTKSLTETLFEFVRDHAHKYYAQEITDRFVTAGHKKSSVSSLLTQMKRNRLVNEDSAGKLYALSDIYNPMPAYKKNKPKEKAKAKGLTALAVAQSPAPIIKSQWDAETVLANMGIKEAHRLYLELHKFFGGAK